MIDNQAEAHQLKQLIDASSKILITSHVSPDPDAVASLLLTGLTLERNFPDKQVRLVLEDEPEHLNFLTGYDEISFKPVYEVLTDFEPDLFLLLDGNNFERCSRQDGQKIREYIATQKISAAVIDHHEVAGKDEVSVFINNASASTAQDVYAVLFDDLGLPKSPDAAQTAMTGFYADTGGFVYVKAGQQDRVFGFAERLVAEGADIEAVRNELENFSEDDMKVIAQLAANITHDGNYSYSSLCDEFIVDWVGRGHQYLQLQRPTNEFLNSYIRNIDDRRWGFIVYKNTLQGENFYSVSLRSQNGVPDVSIIASSLGGGGHKPAAGAKFEAASLDQAIKKVKSAISASSSP